MLDFTKIPRDELLKMNKETLVTIIGSLQGQLNSIDQQLTLLTEQIALMNQRTFGRRTERLVDLNQISLFELFNEAELFTDDSPEPKIQEVTISGYSRKKKTSREENLEGLPARIIEHTISEEELTSLFPKGYKELPIETYKRLAVIPQTIIVDEHHVHVYASKDNDGTIIRAERPADVFRNSLATPSLLSMIISNKFEKHLPLDRQSQLFQKEGLKLETNTMSNWMIKTAENYMSILYDEFLTYLKQSRLIHADETSVKVVHDGRPAGSKSWMWVYCSGQYEKAHPVVLYDYQKGRSTNPPKEFLKDYSGTLMTDGYQVYHTLEKQRDDLKVAGCWVHAKRKFADKLKSNPSDQSSEATIAAEAVKRISEIFHLDNQLDTLAKTKREKERKLVVKPKVNDFFAWVKQSILLLPASCDTARNLQYCINQETFLRRFLADGDIPMDNNRAERAIRPFTVGRKNWVLINSLQGAEASAILYSIIETAKANNLRIYEYLSYVLEEMPKHMDDTDRSFLEDLMPWSDKAQARCRVLTKKS